MSPSPPSPPSTEIYRARLTPLHLHLSDLRTLDDRHADRPVSIAIWHDEMGGTSSSVVVKRFTGVDATERALALHCTGLALWASTAGAQRPTPVVPRPIAVGTLDDGVAVVMEALVGAAIGARGDLGRSVELAPECAALFADLHTARPECVVGGRSWPGVPRRPADRVVRSTSRKLAELTERAELTPDVASAARGLEMRMRSWSVDISRRGEELVITHGDAAPRNVLATPSGLRLIDLDRVHLAGAARDVAYWLAWAHATAWTGRAGQQPTDDLLVHYLARRASIARDASAAGSSPSAVDAPSPTDAPEALCPDLPFHLAAAFIRIAHGWSVLRADPSAQRCVLERATSLVDEASGWIDTAWRRAVGLDTGHAAADGTAAGGGSRCGGGRAGENMPGCGRQGEAEARAGAGDEERNGRRVAPRDRIGR